MFLEKLFVFSKCYQVVIVKDDIPELWVEFVFSEARINFFQIGEESVFFQLKINIAICKPGLG